MRTDVLGVGFDSITTDEAASCVLAMIDAGRGGYICTPNPEIVMRCQDDEALFAAVQNADLIVADGIGVVRAAKTLGRPLPERVAGIDLFTAVLSRMRGRLYLLGGRPGVAEAAARVIAARFPDVTICGVRDGYFTDESAVIADIAAARPDITAVCLGSPKQEYFMAAHHGQGLGVMLGLGGALDVLSGIKKRAPEPWRARGLEWLWRLLHEPRRLGRQLRLAAFISAVKKQRKQEWIKED